MAQSDSMSQAKSELSKNKSENPTLVATDELQLHDLVRAEAWEQDSVVSGES